jgi:hypothetical protein
MEKRNYFRGYLIFTSWVILLLGVLQLANAQDIALKVSSTYDQNIFDTYSSLRDLVTEPAVDISKGWDYDQAYLGVFYSGALVLYKDLPARNYHLHTAMVGWTYHFAPAEEEQNEDEYSPDEDSTGSSETTSTLQSNTPPVVHSDSLDQFLYTSIIGAMQFNKEAYKQWDNTVAGATITFRQPLGVRVSFRPAYSLTYHAYPSISGLTNFQNSIGVTIGTDVIPKTWVSITASFGYKSYPNNQSGQDTIYVTKPGHGKGGGTTEMVIQYNFTTPSVSQPWLTMLGAYKPMTGTECTAQFSYYLNPSSTARELPKLRNGASAAPTIIQGLDIDQNELYDDHFSFNGIELNATVHQSLPLMLNLTAGFIFQHKTYTYSAKDLADSSLAINRKDNRSDISLKLERSFSIAKENTINLVGEYHYLRNGSNAPYFDFEKNKFMLGLEYSF